MREDLLQPSLSEDYIPAKSFNLRYIYILAFFGGVVPIIGICGKNAKWLGIEKNKIYKLAALGIFFLIVKIVLLFIHYSGTPELANRSVITTIYRICCLGLTYLYLRVMKEPYSRHRLANLPTERMRFYVILYMVVGFFVDILISFPINEYFGN